MKSEMYMDELVSNKERKFGSARYYFPCRIINAQGQAKMALFSGSQIKLATSRAEKNPEDIPEIKQHESASVWKRIFAFWR